MLLLASCLLLFQRLPSASSQETQAPPAWSFLVLTRAWEATYCLQHKDTDDRCFHDASNAFTIRGLSPRLANGTALKKCSRNGFTEAMVQPLLPQLQAQWPTSVTSTDGQTWRREWLLHGTCMEKEYGTDPNKFFSTILGLDKQWNLTAAILQRIGFLKEVDYAHTWFEDVVSEHFGHRVSVVCDTGMLSEVAMCFDRQLEHIDCPSVLTSGEKAPCGKSVRIPKPRHLVN